MPAVMGEDPLWYRTPPPPSPPPLMASAARDTEECLRTVLGLVAVDAATYRPEPRAGVDGADGSEWNPNVIEASIDSRGVLRCAWMGGGAWWWDEMHLASLRERFDAATQMQPHTPQGRRRPRPQRRWRPPRRPPGDDCHEDALGVLAEDAPELTALCAASHPLHGDADSTDGNGSACSTPPQLCSPRPFPSLVAIADALAGVCDEVDLSTACPSAPRRLYLRSEHSAQRELPCRPPPVAARGDHTGTPCELLLRLKHGCAAVLTRQALDNVCGAVQSDDVALVLSTVDVPASAPTAATLDALCGGALGDSVCYDALEAALVAALAEPDDDEVDVEPAPVPAKPMVPRPPQGRRRPSQRRLVRRMPSPDVAVEDAEECVLVAARSGLEPAPAVWHCPAGSGADAARARQQKQQDLVGINRALRAARISAPCAMCRCAPPDAASVTCGACRRSACAECFAKHVTQHATNGATATSITCVHPWCDRRVPDLALKAHLPAGVYATLASNEVRCGVCRSAVLFDGSVADVPYCEGCGRHACEACFVKHINQHAAREHVGIGALRCVLSGCDRALPREYLQRYLPAAELERLEANEVQMVLRNSTADEQAGMAKTLQCPSCSVVIQMDLGGLEHALAEVGVRVAASPSRTIELDGVEMDAAAAAHYTRWRLRCAACTAVFCAECLAVPYHHGQTCADAACPLNCRLCAAPLRDARLTREGLAQAMGIDTAAPPRQSWWRRFFGINRPPADAGAGGQVIAVAAAAAVNVAAGRAGRGVVPAPPTDPAAVPDVFLDAVCNAPACAGTAARLCKKQLPCGHLCAGVDGEVTCAPCLHVGCAKHPANGPTTDDFCPICWTDSLGAAPCVELPCGHVVHHECLRRQLAARWATPEITFAFRNCPLCDTRIHHVDPQLRALLEPVDRIYAQVLRRMHEQLYKEEYSEWLHNDDAGTSPIPKTLNERSLARMVFYQCFACKKPYYGGAKMCGAAPAGPDGDGEAAKDPTQYICTWCAEGTFCRKHGGQYMQFKCRYCCDMAVWFCWGTTHLCNRCHRRRVVPEIPCKGRHACPLKGAHPPNGIEHAIGCAACEAECGDGRAELIVRTEPVRAITPPPKDAVVRR